MAVGPTGHPPEQTGSSPIPTRECRQSPQVGHQVGDQLIRPDVHDRSGRGERGAQNWRTEFMRRWAAVGRRHPTWGCKLKTSEFLMFLPSFARTEREAFPSRTFPKLALFGGVCEHRSQNTGPRQRYAGTMSISYRRAKSPMRARPGPASMGSVAPMGVRSASPTRSPNRTHAK